MSVRVKNIYIELPEYKFYAEDNPIYIGREQAKKDLIKRLKPNGEEYKGAYLVSGYRGMGKTTLVKRVIKELGNTKHTSLFAKEPDKVKEITVNLAQGDLSDYDVLRQLFTQFSSSYRKDLPPLRFKLGLSLIHI